MPKFAANLSTMFNEHPFPQRFRAAREAGFDAVEFQSHYEFGAEEIGGWLRQHGLTLALFNGPYGNQDAGDRGLAAVPDREDEFRASIETAIAYAEATGGRRLHVMAGIVADADRLRAATTYQTNLRWAAERCREAGIEALIEPINDRSVPGYFLNRTGEALDLIARLGAPNLKLQLDIYHQQIMDGDLTRTLEQAMPVIGHVQVASVPGRNEPDEGEIDYRYVFRLLDSLGYDGWVGCEYRPRGATIDGLDWRRTLVCD